MRARLRSIRLGSGSQPGWARWISAALFAAVLLCFFLPFASTSCTLPGGYGNGAQGTSTVYHGTDFLTGSEPSLNQNGVPPSNQPESGVVLGVQIPAILAVLSCISGLAASLVVRRRRHLTALCLAVVAGLLLILNQLSVRQQIADRISHDFNARLVSGKVPSDYVNNEPGFWLALLLLLGAAILNGIAVQRERRKYHRTGGV